MQYFLDKLKEIGLILKHEYFDDFIRELNFDIVEKDTSSHSIVYVFAPIR